MNKTNTNHNSPCTCFQGPTQCVEYFIFLVKTIYLRETGGINAKGLKLHNAIVVNNRLQSQWSFIFHCLPSLWKNPYLLALRIAGDVSHGGMSATQWQKFHKDDTNQCLHNKFGSHRVAINLSNFTCFLVDFGKVSLFICQWAPAKLKCFF